MTETSKHLRAEGAKLLRPLNEPDTQACFCTGPRPGEPVCPCMMRSVKVIDGRYMRITDLGPAPNHGIPASMLKIPPGVLKGSWED